MQVGSRTSPALTRKSVSVSLLSVVIDKLLALVQVQMLAEALVLAPVLGEAPEP